MSKEHTLDDCLARVIQISGDELQGYVSITDKQCLKKTLMEIIHLREQLHDLREAISPGRIGKPEYYLGVAARLRAKDTVIRALDHLELGPHMNPTYPHCGSPITETGCSNGLCEAVN